MDEKVGKGKWVSDWFGGDEVLKQIYDTISIADAYRRMLYREPWDYLHPYFIELRILFSKIGPLMVKTNVERYQERIDDLRDQVDAQVSVYNKQTASYSTTPTKKLDYELAENLEELHDDLLRFMQKAKLWIPASYAREAQSKKRNYFGVERAKRKGYKRSE